MLTVVLVGAAALATAPASRAAVLISTRITGGGPARTIPRSFAGFSSDWNAVYKLTGNADTGPNPVYRQLVANLTRYGGGTPILRIGGNYQDSAWWNPANLTPDYRRGVFVNIRPTLMQELAANARALAQSMILGIDLGVNDLGIARAEARAILQYIPRRRILGLEIGNEPDFYPNRPAYEKRDANGKLISTLYTRPRGFNGATYLRQWERMAAALHKVSRRLPLVGTAGYGQIVSAQRFVRREHKRLAFYTEHAYPMAACSPRGHVYQPGEKKYPTIQKLLGPIGAYTTVSQEKRGVAAAHRWHKRYVVSEMNSISCTSKIETSGSFAATLWALDQLLLQVSLGVDGVAFHVDSPVKTPFQFSVVGPRSWAGSANPLYYALLAFDAAAGRRGRLLYAPTYLARTKANARVWAVRSGRQLRVVVVNKDLRRGGTVRITVPRSKRRGRLARILAPGIQATSGVTFAGQAIATPTSDGKLEGAPQTEVVRPQRGVYSFSLPKASAAVLTIG